MPIVVYTGRDLSRKEETELKRIADAIIVKDVRAAYARILVDANTALLALRIPDARVELFPGGGHLFFWEQPERFVGVVTEFLA